MLLSTAVLILNACSPYDDSDLTDRVDDLKKRVEALNTKIDQLNEQVTTAQQIFSGNVITSVSRNSDGRYVVTYKDSKDKEYALLIATKDDVIDVPVLGVALGEDGIYYWTQVADGQTSWLMADGEKIPVSGHQPVISIDSEDYWTVDGKRITTADNRPIKASTDESSIFRAAAIDADGNLGLTLGDGSQVTLPVVGTLNITHDAQTVTSVADLSKTVTVKYALTGSAASQAMFDIALADGIGVVLDKQKCEIEVSFPSDFQSGKLIMLAYDMDQNTVIKPIIFRRMASGNVEIFSAADLMAFAAEVNAGGDAAKKTVVLMNDIDMKNAGEWIPIGNGTFTWASNKVTISGPAFSGTFDGQGHSILNFAPTAANSTAGGVYGLFGILDKATVKHLTIGAPEGDAGSFTVAVTASADTGVIAGMCYDSSIEGCTNYIPMNFNGTSTARVTMGLVGFVFADAGASISDCTNYGTITAAGGGNTTSGATSIQVGGIAGFASNDIESTDCCRLLNCINRGDMTSATARTSGIVAAANRYTSIEGCVNYGHQTNSFATSGGGRLGNITCILGTGSSMTSCVNNGDLISTTSARVGGLVSLVNHATCTIANSANYGRIISDVDGYRGALWGYCGVAAVVTDNVVAGAVGSYNAGKPELTELTETNFMDYLGKIGSTTPQISGTRFGGKETVGIKTADDLVAFAKAVNEGTSTAQWQDESGAVVLACDIDMSGVGEWTPIGNGTFTWAGNVLAISGPSFDGTFDGQGYAIRNFKYSTTNSTAGGAFGLFGILNGATVKNLVMGAATSDQSMFTVAPSDVTDAGVIAGLCNQSQVSDCVNYIPMLYDGTCTKRVTMAMVGFVFCNDTPSRLANLVNRAEITAKGSGNTTAGATAIHAAGIAGFSTNDVDSKVCNSISYCDNYGQMTSLTARTSGIVAAANRYTSFESCTNHGNQLNSFPTLGGGRLGNITCITGTGCTLNECVNRGNLVSTTEARCGGIVSLPNHVTNTFTGCANYGEIITNSAYRGTMWGYNTLANSWIECTAGGKVGLYNDGTTLYDSYEQEFNINYLGKLSSTKPNLSNIVYAIAGESGGGGSSVEPTLRILFIGNSFTKDAVEHLPGMIAAAGIKSVKMVHMYYGGRTIAEYNDGYSTVSDYTVYKCETGWSVWGAYSGYSIQDMVKSDKWDIVTIQEHTGKSCAWAWNTTQKAAIDGLVTKIKADMSAAPKFAYILSQAYGNPTVIPSYGQIAVLTSNFASQDAMYAAITAHGQKVMVETQMEDVIATGTVLQNLRTSTLNNEVDLTRDGYHMDFGISRYAAACAVFEKLISPAFDGVKLDANTYRYSTSNTTLGSYSTPVTDANAPIALKAARLALETPYSVTSMAHAEGVSGELGRRTTAQTARGRVGNSLSQAANF